MSELDATINVRTSAEKRDAVDAAAQDEGMNRSAWLNKVIDEALRIRAQGPQGRQVTVVRRERLITPGSVPARLCNHPYQLRSEPHPESGETICMACRAVFRPLS